MFGSGLVVHEVNAERKQTLQISNHMKFHLNQICRMGTNRGTL